MGAKGGGGGQTKCRCTATFPFHRCGHWLWRWGWACAALNEGCKAWRRPAKLPAAGPQWSTHPRTRESAAQRHLAADPPVCTCAQRDTHTQRKIHVTLGDCESSHVNFNTRTNPRTSSGSLRTLTCQSYLCTITIKLARASSGSEAASSLSVFDK